MALISRRPISMTCRMAVPPADPRAANEAISQAGSVNAFDKPLWQGQKRIRKGNCGDG